MHSKKHQAAQQLKKANLPKPAPISLVLAAGITDDLFVARSPQYVLAELAKKEASNA